MQIGPYKLSSPLILAPMAGVTDYPFRSLCRSFGAGLAVSEMISGNPELWGTRKSQLRRYHAGEAAPVAVQIAGSDPQQLAEAARFEVDHGADIIDINMGCPAKKVCKRDAGSALLADEALVGRILDAVTTAVSAPVTLKIRTGISPDRRNAVAIARLAQDCGIAALAVHGRTREELFKGQAEHQTVAAVKQAVSIPIMVNGDIDSPEEAASVMTQTQADGLMIGRAAQGRPWIFRDIEHFFAHGVRRPDPESREVGAILLAHLDHLYGFYGERQGVRVARKHIQWYCRAHSGAEAFWREVCRVDQAVAQREAVHAFFMTATRAEAPALLSAA